MTVSEDVRDVANKAITSLPSQFVALLFINALFLVALMWFVADVAVTRIEAVTKIFEVCTRTLGKG